MLNTKKVFLICLLTGFTISALAQDAGPKEVTPQKLQSIKIEVEKMVPAFKKKNAVNNQTAAKLEFMVDTFRIDQAYKKTIDIDYSTAGMRNATNTRREAYDKLLNKYYNRLLKLLKPADQKMLIAAQRSWIAFRDNEGKLIGTMMDDEYSGGGTIQQIIATGRGADMVVARACTIAGYYLTIVDNK